MHSMMLKCWMLRMVESTWDGMAHGDAREGKWRGNWRMESVASTRHITSERSLSSITTITTADAHTLAASSQLNWHLRWFKWTRLFCQKTKSGFCACAITFQTQSNMQCDGQKAESFIITLSVMQPPFKFGSSANHCGFLIQAPKSQTQMRSCAAQSKLGGVYWWRTLEYDM
jgi:hypothetical protein